jgi:hypothetical protein
MSMAEAATRYHTACSATTDQQVYFAEGTPAMVALEAMVDKVGLQRAVCLGAYRQCQGGAHRGQLAGWKLGQGMGQASRQA